MLYTYMVTFWPFQDKRYALLKTIKVMVSLEKASVFKKAILLLIRSGLNST